MWGKYFPKVVGLKINLTLVKKMLRNFLQLRQCISCVTTFLTAKVTVKGYKRYIATVRYYCRA